MNDSAILPGTLDLSTVAAVSLGDETASCDHVVDAIAMAASAMRREV